jgi:hypothetical protein
MPIFIIGVGFDIEISSGTTASSDLFGGTEKPTKISWLRAGDRHSTQTTPTTESCLRVRRPAPACLATRRRFDLLSEKLMAGRVSKWPTRPANDADARQKLRNAAIEASASGYKERELIRLVARRHITAARPPAPARAVGVLGG